MKFSAKQPAGHSGFRKGACGPQGSARFPLKKTLAMKEQHAQSGTGSQKKVTKKGVPVKPVVTKPGVVKDLAYFRARAEEKKKRSCPPVKHVVKKKDEMVD
mmetsp:Transcript_21193/g.49746  ORF Transcript_21193/g.49746 Transcript_21193/m.49746 type:complete len:101 (-) Transcript_21193:189-491(-)